MESWRSLHPSFSALKLCPSLLLIEQLGPFRVQLLLRLDEGKRNFLCFPRVDSRARRETPHRRRQPTLPCAIRLISLLECFPTTCPFPGRPPPSAPKMAGIIPLVHNTICNVRSSENVSLPFPRQRFLFTAINISREKAVVEPFEPYLLCVSSI